MRGRIDNSGWLIIQRGTRREVEQRCLYDNSPTVVTFCGDECPHFGEPELDKREIEKLGEEPVTRQRVYLQICQGRILEFEEFEDDRE